MTIQASEASIEVKSKQATFFCDQKKLNDIMLDGPGEYEIADMAVKVFETALVQIQSEGITLIWCDRAILQIELEGLAELQDSDAMILRLSEDSLPTADAQRLIRTLNPKVIIPHDHHMSNELCKTIGNCPEPVKNFKITKASLAEHDIQKIVLLH